MFCPKCGTKNPEDGKFCRSCGVDLGNVSAALSGGMPAHVSSPAIADLHHRIGRRSEPHEVYAAAIRNIISGVGFLIVSIALLTTGVAGGHAWWWAMLFPAFTFLARGISDYMKYGKMEQARGVPNAAYTPELNHSRSNAALPPNRTDYVPAGDTRYKTGDLVPPSVTDNTTRHLEINPDGETMTLPKK